MAEAGPGATGGYVAFISYSHKDAAMGRWLHRRLEGYRLPRRLAGTQGADGEIPARLTPIFRDRDELPAAGDLSERVRAALAVSKNLIVLCSPSSAASPWVAKEIATFRELHPGRPILSAIVDGGPDQCFPPVLREGGIEPLAADLRKEGDGHRLGLLKLVAGLAGIGLDTLVQRDAARRVRRITYVTAAAVAAMLVMALLTALAINARAEAERQRAEAEGLVEFMLTDLRQTLKAVGRIDVLTLVNRRALARYGTGDVKNLPEDALLRRARLRRAIGEDEVVSGNLASALGAFEDARRVTAEQLARHPADPERLLQHAHSEYWIGRVYEIRREWPMAQRQYTRFAALTERAIVADPQNPDYMLEVAASAVDLGNVHLNGNNDAPAAQRSYEKAVVWFEKAGRARPADSETLLRQANAYAWLADSYYMQSLWPRSLRARQAQHAIVETLHRSEPSNMQNGFRLALAQRGLGRSLIKVGDKAGAEKQLHQAYSWSRRLIGLDPDNAEWLLFAGLMGCDLRYADLGLPPGATRAALRSQVESAASTLTRRKDPHGKDFTRCLRLWDEYQPKRK
ncbi:MAG TPA: toll/interleukin-1 receptor domain-containing protein [Allosphingosinicella sp.]|nr:toll/interleukin-1 receptor domain-containing protein [Allosphingosinicella sp.]